MLTVTITNTIMSKTRNAGGGGGIPPSNTVAPVISGTAVVGQTLSSTTGTWIGTPIPTYTYQWYRGVNPISGATSSTYTLVQADATFSVTCVVTATNPAGIASATSNALTIIDADAQAFFTASGLTGTTNQSAINQLVVDLKGYGIWTKMKAIYPIIGGTAALHKWNLKDPQDTDAAFRLTFNGGWTHNSNGITGNGTNNWANTFLVPNTDLLLNSTHISAYTRSNITVDAPLLSSENNTTYDNGLYIWARYHTLMSSVRINDNTSSSVSSPADIRGLHIATRTASNVKNYRFNQTQQFSLNVTSTARNTSSISLGSSRNNTNYNSSNLAFSSIGEGLSNSECDNLYLAVQAYQTTLSRQVP